MFWPKENLQTRMPFPCNAEVWWKMDEVKSGRLKLYLMISMLIIWYVQRNENMSFRRITYESNYETCLVPCQPRDAPPLIRKWGQRTHESNLPLRSLQYKGRNMSPPTRFFQSFSLCRRRFLALWSPSQPYCVTRPKMPRHCSLIVQILNTNSSSYFSRVRT